MTVRNTVREHRIRCKLSVRELARQVQVDDAQLSRVERQLNTVNDDAKVRIAQYLSVPVADLWFPDYASYASLPSGMRIETVEQQSTPACEDAA